MGFLGTLRAALHIEMGFFLRIFLFLLLLLLKQETIGCGEWWYWYLEMGV